MLRTIFQRVFLFLPFFILFFPHLFAQTADTTGLFSSIKDFGASLKATEGKAAQDSMVQVLLDFKKNQLNGLEHSIYDAQFQTVQFYFYKKIKRSEEAAQAARAALSLYAELEDACASARVQLENDFGRALAYQNQLPEAKERLSHALQCLEARKVKDTSVILSAQMTLGAVYFYMGNSTEARRLFEAYIKGTALFYGKETTDYAGGIVNLGNTYYAENKFELATAYYMQALELLERIERQDHQYYEVLLNNLGALYGILQDFKKGEEILLKSLEQIKKNGALNTINHGITLEGLAKVQNHRGDREGAKTSYEAARKIIKETEGENSITYLGNCYGMASVCTFMGEYDKAESLLMEALAICEKDSAYIYSKNDYESVLANLGELYYKKKDYEKADKYNKKALAAFHKRLNISQMNLRMSNSFANLYYDMGLIAKADSILELARKGSLEEGLVLYVQNDNPVMRVLTKAALGDYAASAAFLKDWSEKERTALGNAISFLSESELTEYLTAKTKGMHKILKETHKNRAQILGFNGIMYDELIALKSYALHSSTALRKKSLTDKKLGAIYYDMMASHRTLSYMESQGSADVALLDSLKERTNLLEKQLARNYDGFDKDLLQLNWTDIQAKLEVGEGAIEFFHYPMGDDVFYVAFLLKKGAEEPILIPLFEEKRLVDIFPANSNVPADIDAFYTWNADKTGLTDLIWNPIAEHAEGLQTLYYAASGLLHQINLNAVPTNASARIMDSKQLIALNSTRALLKEEKPVYTTLDASLFGGIEYNIDTLNRTASAVGENRQKTRGALKLIQQFRNMQPNEEWVYLDATNEELNAISQLLQNADYEVLKLVDAAASEQKFKTQNGTSARILHLATHAYFFPESGVHQHVEQSGAAYFQSNERSMIRSGLILAGANYAWKYGKLHEHAQEDGILTAYEISQLDLRQTELVVLSACETGLGDIKGSEGVYGLQRAFKMAGAQQLLLSLWQVSDFHTKELMGYFYENLLNKKMKVSEALAAAQKTMQQQGYAPFYWAGFIVLE